MSVKSMGVPSPELAVVAPDPCGEFLVGSSILYWYYISSGCTFLKTQHMGRGKSWISYYCSLRGELFSEWESLYLLLFDSCLWPNAWVRQREKPVGILSPVSSLPLSTMWALDECSPQLQHLQVNRKELLSFFDTYIPHCIMCVLLILPTFSGKTLYDLCG